jgi:hypothetical protein
VPADADAGAHLPLGNVGAHGIEKPHHFMSRNTRKATSRECPHHGEHVAVTNAARLYFDPDLSGSRNRDVACDQLEWTVGA